MHTPDPLDVQIGSLIRLCRMQRGLKQNEFAGLVGVRPSAMAHYESGHTRVRASLLYRMAGALDVSPVVLLPDENSGENRLQIVSFAQEEAMRPVTIEDNDLRQKVLDLVRWLGRRKK